MNLAGKGKLELNLALVTFLSLSVASQDSPSVCDVFLRQAHRKEEQHRERERPAETNAEAERRTTGAQKVKRHQRRRL